MWIYLRISDDDEGTALGVDRQRADCLKRAERDGWSVLGVIEENDTGASRHSTKGRPKYRAMLESLARGEGNAVLAYSNSRLTRRPRELEDVIDLHDKYGVQIRTIVSGDDDLSTADGRMVARIKSNVDAAEAGRISERVRREQRAGAENGFRHIGGPRPYGWNRVIRKGHRPLYEPHPVEASLLADAITRIVGDEATLGKIMREWNEAGQFTVTGKRWTYALLRSVLRRTANGGYFYGAGEDGIMVERTLADIKGEPIVTAQMQKDLLRILSDPARLTTKSWEPRYLGSGIASCGKTGCTGGRLRSASVTTRGMKYRIYRCDGHQVNRTGDHEVQCGLSIKMDTLDNAIIDAVADAYAFSGSGTPPAGVDTGLSARMVAVRAQIPEINAERDKLRSLNDVYSTDEIRAAVQPLNDERDRLTRRLDDLVRSDAHASMTFAALGELYVDSFGRHHASLGMPTSDDVRSRFDGMPLAKRRTIIRSLFDVTVNPGRGPDRITITRTPLPSAP